jgi:hypothetical protein
MSDTKLKSRPYRIKEGKYYNNKKNIKTSKTQYDLIHDIKKHHRYDLSKYNKKKSIERTAKKVEDTDINLKLNIRKNTYKDIKNLEDKIKNDEKLTDEEKQRYELYINQNQGDEKLIIQDYKEAYSSIFDFTAAEEKDLENFTNEEQTLINNQSNRSRANFIKQIIRQKKINIEVERMLNILFNTNIKDSKFKIDYWNGLKNGREEYIKTLYSILYSIHEKSKTDIYDYVIIEKNNKLNNPFQLFLGYRNNKQKSRDDVINNILENITPNRFNKFQKLKLDIDNFIPGGDLIGKALKTKYLPPLYESDINDYYKNNTNYIGTYAIDEVKNIPNKDIIKGYGFIVNNSTRNDENPNNKHWTAVYLDKYNVEMFDPLAKHNEYKKIISQLKPIIENNNVLMKLKKNSNIVQNPLSYLCGYHSIDFLDKKFNGSNFKEATNYNQSFHENTKEIRNKFNYI